MESGFSLFDLFIKVLNGSESVYLRCLFFGVVEDLVRIRFVDLYDNG